MGGVPPESFKPPKRTGHLAEEDRSKDWPAGEYDSISLTGRVLLWKVVYIEVHQGYDCDVLYLS